MEKQPNNQTNFTIRQATPDDALGIAELLRDLGWSDWIVATTLETTTVQIKQHLALCHADDSHAVYVAETSDGEVAGYVSVHWLPYLMYRGPEGFVSELFVKTSFRGYGIGSRLLTIVKAEAEKRGCVRLGLLNNRERESYHRQFYKKQGWQERDWIVHFAQWLD